MIPKWKINILWVVALIAWPFVLWISYHHYFISIEGNVLDIFLFAIFMCIVALFPITIQEAPVFFVNGISIAVFLSFGLFVEIILTIVAVLLVLFRSGIKRSQSYRIPLNMLMFAVISILSVEIYKMFGGSHGEILHGNTTEIVAIFVYAISIFIINQLLIKLINFALLGQKSKFFDKGLRWELTSSLLVIPVGFVLYILYSEIGRAAIFYLSIPFISISVILKLLYNYQEVNRYLKRTGEVGHRLAQNLEVTEVFNVFMHDLVNLLPVNGAYVYQAVGEKELKLIRSEHSTTSSNESYDGPESFSMEVLSTKQPILFKSSKEWAKSMHFCSLDNAESVLSLPIEYNDQIIGVVTVISSEKKSYDKIHLRILNIVTSYLGVAIKNAQHYETTKNDSEKDGLTNLYNYRFLEKTLELHFEGNPKDLGATSIIILDIDHFKMINDTYGHEAGNEILRELANRLKIIIGDEGLVARYGGEEFIVFLPGVALSEASRMAEMVRREIQKRSFQVDNHILNQDEPVDIAITASVGVATYPEHCESPTDLIRYADRAMYIGAKQKGRNKVGVYNDLNSEFIL
ncbi:diguanylate cyclase with GAF sensor [Oceanobacillus limi]|uniref:Diguanylate cyclase with GAF sensor n=1 Tax=Oceanobacillus limi TaxID=930131 RepID=A0A1I0GGH9_9BACI|nr:diguanylate cyclase [Oceanobacillus limi]SET69995.1 diguanylate cyclase with GAF sensor [Oceanobacillus limi]